MEAGKGRHSKVPIILFTIFLAPFRVGSEFCSFNYAILKHPRIVRYQLIYKGAVFLSPEEERVVKSHG